MYMCVCICVRVCLCVYRYVCVCVGLCNTQEHPGLQDTLWFYPESRMGISQKCWVLQSKADNCYLTKNLGAFKLKRTFLCTREWWLQYVKCWDPPPGASLVTSPTRFGRTMSFESNTVASTRFLSLPLTAQQSFCNLFFRIKRFWKVH